MNNNYNFEDLIQSRLGKAYRVQKSERALILADLTADFSLEIPMADEHTITFEDATAFLASFDMRAEVDAIIEQRVQAGKQPNAATLVWRMEDLLEIVKDTASMIRPKEDVQPVYKPVATVTQLHRGENDLATVYPQLAAEWSKTENGNVTPRDVTHLDSHDKRDFTWECPCCGHHWKASVRKRVSGKACPQCGETVMREN